MAEDRNILSARLGAFLTGRYPVLGRDKLLARDIGVSPRTARNYCSGYWPGARAWRSIARAFGRDVIAAVFEPEFDEAQAQLAAEIRALEDQLNARKAALRAVAGGQEGLAQPADWRR